MLTATDWRRAAASANSVALIRRACVALVSSMCPPEGATSLEPFSDMTSMWWCVVVE